MFRYANELTLFETDWSRELLQTAMILNIRECTRGVRLIPGLDV